MDKINEFNKLMNEAVIEGVFPGANVVIVSDKSYFMTYGNKANFPIEEKNDIDTLYDMASCSKVISTTTSILILLEKGKIKLYDNVSSYLPEFKYDNITIFDLLTHTSGLPADVSKAYMIKSREELMEKIFNLELKYQKGTNIVYSDIGFILLGLIVEKVSGITLDIFASENIFKPLEMNNTCYNPKDTLKCAPTEKRCDDVLKAMIRGKAHDEKAYIMGGVAGHAGLFSCVKDLEKFIKMILNNGVYNGRRILSATTIDLLFTPKVRKTNGVSLDYDQRGLGWIVKGDYPSSGDLASKETIYHTGFTGTNIVIDRINKVGFAILSNRVHPTRNNTKIIPWRGKIGNFIIANFNMKNDNN